MGFLICWEQHQRLDVWGYENLSPVEVNIPLQNHPITVSHIVISGSGSDNSANLEIPLIPKGKIGELIAKNNEYDGAEDIEAVIADIDVDIWRVVEIPLTI